MGGKEEIGPTPTSTGEQNQNKWTQIIFLITLIDSKAWRILNLRIRSCYCYLEIFSLLQADQDIPPSLHRRCPFRFRPSLIFRISVAAALTSDLWFAVSRSAVDGSSYIKMKLHRDPIGWGNLPQICETHNSSYLPQKKKTDGGLTSCRGVQPAVPSPRQRFDGASKALFCPVSLASVCVKSKCQMQLLISLRAMKFRLAEAVCVRRKARQKCLFHFFEIIVYLESSGCQTYCSSSSL